MASTVAALNRAAVEQHASRRGEPAWLVEARLAAWERFEALPTPTTRDDGWKRTDLSGLDLERLAEPAAQAVAGPTDRGLTAAAGDSADQAGLLVLRDGQVERSQLAEGLATGGVLFTSLAEEMDPEDIHTIMTAYFGELVPAITRYGGVVEKFIGDAVMAVFGNQDFSVGAQSCQIILQFLPQGFYFGGRPIGSAFERQAVADHNDRHIRQWRCSTDLILARQDILKLDALLVELQFLSPLLHLCRSEQRLQSFVQVRVDGIHEHESPYFVRVRAGKEMNVQAAERLPDQNIRGGNRSLCQQLVQLSDHLLARSREMTRLAHS